MVEVEQRGRITEAVNEQEEIAKIGPAVAIKIPRQDTLDGVCDNRRCR